jgi:hypothetical protein
MSAFQLIAAGISAFGQMAAGQAAQESAELDAFNTETQRELSKVETLQRHNDRLEQYRYNVKANISAFYAAGRDVGSDKSVSAFLQRQKEVVAEDTGRSDLMGFFEQMKLQQQATTMRVEGRARKQAATIGAFTTMAQGIADYSSTGKGSSGGI